MKRSLYLSALLCLFPTLCRGQNSGHVITLDFDSLENLESVGDYYNGGLGSLGSGPGPNYGISFGADSEVVTSKFAPGGGSGNFTNEPSSYNAVFFQAGGGDVLNIASGFTGGFSFFYTGPLAGSVTVWSGPDGTGTQLASLDLPAIASNPSTRVNDTWAPVGVSFAGVAGSVNFSGVANFIAFDNITLGSATPTGSSVPAPSSLVVVGVAALLGAGCRRRRKS